MSQDQNRPEQGADPLTLLRTRHHTALAGAALVVIIGLVLIALTEGQLGAQFNLGLTTLLIAACIGVYAGALDIALTTLRSIAVQHDDQDRAVAVLAERLDGVERRERQMAGQLGDYFADDLSRRRSG